MFFNEIKINFSQSESGNAINSSSKARLKKNLSKLAKETKERDENDEIEFSKLRPGEKQPSDTALNTDDQSLSALSHAGEENLRKREEELRNQTSEIDKGFDEIDKQMQASLADLDKLQENLENKKTNLSIKNPLYELEEKQEKLKKPLKKQTAKTIIDERKIEQAIENADQAIENINKQLEEIGAKNIQKTKTGISETGEGKVFDSAGNELDVKTLEEYDLIDDPVTKGIESLKKNQENLEKSIENQEKNKKQVKFADTKKIKEFNKDEPLSALSQTKEINTNDKLRAKLIKNNVFKEILDEDKTKKITNSRKDKDDLINVYYDSKKDSKPTIQVAENVLVNSEKVLKTKEGKNGYVLQDMSGGKNSIEISKNKNGQTNYDLKKIDENGKEPVLNLPNGAKIKLDEEGKPHLFIKDEKDLKKLQEKFKDGVVINGQNFKDLPYSVIGKAQEQGITAGLEERNQVNQQEKEKKSIKDEDIKSQRESFKSNAQKTVSPKDSIIDQVKQIGKENLSQAGAIQAGNITEIQGPAATPKIEKPGNEERTR